MMTIRPRKDGGCSECRSPDELVGRGRCCHILGDANNPAMVVERVQRGLYGVQIGDDVDVQLDIAKGTIKKFFDGLRSLPEDQVNSLLKQLCSEEGVL